MIILYAFVNFMPFTLRVRQRERERDIHKIHNEDWTICVPGVFVYCAVYMNVLARSRGASTYYRCCQHSIVSFHCRFIQPKRAIIAHKKHNQMFSLIWRCVLTKFRFLITLWSSHIFSTYEYIWAECFDWGTTLSTCVCVMPLRDQDTLA